MPSTLAPYFDDVKLRIALNFRVSRRSDASYTSDVARSSADHRELVRDTWRLFTDYSFRSMQRFTTIARDAGLSPGDVKALMSFTPGEPRPMRALAEVLGCDASTVTWLVDRLEQHGYVERRSWPNDRRVRAIALTEAGEKMQRMIRGRLFDPPADLVALDASDLTALHAVLGKLVPAATTAEAGCPRPAGRPPTPARARRRPAAG